MQIGTRNIFGFIPFLLVLISHASYADGKLKESQIYAKKLSKSSEIHVHLFSTSEANLGNQEFRDTADAMAKSAPHLLATDIDGALRLSGFTAVSLDETEGEPSEDALNLTGRLAKNSSNYLRLSVSRSSIFPFASTPQMANEFLAKSMPKRIILFMDLLTLCLDEVDISILALRCRLSGEVHVIRYRAGYPGYCI